MKFKLKKYIVCAIDEKLPQQVELQSCIDYGHEVYYWMQTSNSDTNAIKLFNNEEDAEIFIENLDDIAVYADEKLWHGSPITSDDAWIEEVDVTIDLPW